MPRSLPRASLEPAQELASAAPDLGGHPVPTTQGLSLGLSGIYTKPTQPNLAPRGRPVLVRVWLDLVLKPRGDR